ncbi:MAG: sugar ABC transporter permease [Clostridia bacterium]|nr:sugar ABC transporter permease [Clostridia bacterium]
MDQIKRFLPFYIMALPGIIYLIINNYMPLVGLQVAFKRFNYGKGIWGSPWNGIKNFEFLFSSNSAQRIIRNTLLYNVAFILIGIVIGVAAAILLNEVRQKRPLKIYQTSILLPYLMSMVIISYLAYVFLGTNTGVINGVIRRLGGANINWYNEPKYWPALLIFIHVWKTLGFNMILYYSSLVGFSQDYYEAAELDGATKWQQITKITLPLLRPTIITLLILQLGQIFRSDFGLFYQVPMNQGALFDVTDTIDTFVYRALLKTPNIGMSSSAGFIQSVVGFIFIMTANGIIRKMSPSDSLF